MSLHPQLPSSVEYSDLTYDSVKSAEEQGMKGKGALTPYFNIDNLKDFSVKVDAYGYQILNLDTSSLFYGCGTGQSDGTYPKPDLAAGGGPGAQLKGLPIQFRRIHFVAAKGKSKDSNHPPEEYFTHVLCSKPVKINPANFEDDKVTSYPAEEGTLSEIREWSSETDEESNYDDRLVIGGGYTGEVIKDIQFFDSGCFTYVKTKKAIAYLRSEDENYSTPQPFSYNSGTIKEKICDILNKIDIIGDLFAEIKACACTNGTVSGQIQCLCELNLEDLTGVPPTGTTPPMVCITC